MSEFRQRLHFWWCVLTGRCWECGSRDIYIIPGWMGPSLCLGCGMGRDYWRNRPSRWAASRSGAAPLGGPTPGEDPR